MNTLDYIFLGLLGLFCLRGFMHGLVREATAIVGLAFGFFAAGRFSRDLAPLLADHLGSGGAADVAAYLLVFVGTMFGVWLVMRVASGVFSLPGLAILDHAAGGLLGFLKGGLLCAVIILALATFLPKAEWLTGSSLAPQVSKVAVHLVRFLPDDMQDSLKTHQRTLEDVRFRLPRFST